jgi:hypothetical protein
MKAIKPNPNQLSLFGKEETPKLKDIIKPVKTVAVGSQGEPKGTQLNAFERFDKLHPSIKEEYTKQLLPRLKAGTHTPEDKEKAETLNNYVNGLSGEEEVSKKFNPVKINIKDGKWHEEGTDLFEGGSLGKKLNEYNTHTNFLNNPKPEHKALADEVKKLHNNNDDEIREHFNNTVGRWRNHDTKPVMPDQRATLMDHERFTDNPEYGQVQDLPEEHKKEIDKFGTGEKFANAVKSGEISPGLKKYLKTFKTDHINQDNEKINKKRDWTMYKGKDSKNDEIWDSDNLKRWFKFPTMSNRETINESGEFDREKAKRNTVLLKRLADKKISNEMFDALKEETGGRNKKQPFSKEYQTSKANPKINPELENNAVSYSDYKKGDKFNYAGQNHTINDVKDDFVFAKGDDGRKRAIKKADIENIKHATPDFDIHSEKFKDLLRGKKKDDMDMLTSDFDIDEMGETPLIKKLKSLGYNKDDMQKIHNYINGKKPIPGEYERAQKSKKKLAEQSSIMNLLDNEGNYKSEDIDNLKNLGNEFDPNSEYAKNVKEYNDKKKDYENLINQKKDKVFNLLHPSANPDYHDKIENKDPELLQQHPELQNLAKENHDFEDFKGNVEKNPNFKSYLPKENKEKIEKINNRKEEIIQNIAHINISQDKKARGMRDEARAKVEEERAKLAEPHEKELSELNYKLKELSKPDFDLMGFHSTSKLNELDKKTRNYDEVHPLSTITKENIYKNLDSIRNSSYNTEQIATKLGIKPNRYTDIEIKKHLKQLENEGKIGLSKDKMGAVRAFIKSITQPYYYLSEKYKKMKLIRNSEERTVDLIKGLSPREVWENADSYRREGLENLSRIIHLSGSLNNDYDKILKSFKDNLYVFCLLLDRQEDIIRQPNFQEIEKSLPIIEAGWDEEKNKPVSIYRDPIL